MADPEAGVAGHSILAAYRASRQDAPNSPVNGGGESPEASSNGRVLPSERSRPCVTKEARSLDRV